MWPVIEKCTALTSPIFKSPSITNGDNYELYPLPADNSSSRVYSGNYFLLLSVPDSGLDSVLFYARQME